MIHPIAAQISVMNYGDSVADIEYVDPIRSKVPMWIEIIQGLTEGNYSSSS